MTDDAHLRALIKEMAPLEADYAARPAAEVVRTGADVSGAERQEIARISGETRPPSKVKFSASLTSRPLFESGKPNRRRSSTKCLRVLCFAVGRTAPPKHPASFAFI